MRYRARRGIMATEGCVRYLSLLLALWIPATAQVAPMLNLVVLEGEGATNNIRQRTARDPIVQVQDENHKPVAGAIVVFTLPSNGAGGAFANGAKTLTMVSDNQGQAVAAASGGATAGAGVSAKLIAVLAVAGAAVAGGVYYATHSGSGTPAAAVIPPGATIVAGTGSAGPPR